MQAIRRTKATPPRTARRIRLDVRHDGVVHVVHIDGVIAIGVRVSLLQIDRDGVHVGQSGLAGDTGLEPRGGLNAGMAASELQAVAAGSFDGRIQLSSSAVGRETEAGRHDANDGGGDAVQVDDPTEDLRVVTEAPRPEAVGDTTTGVPPGESSLSVNVRPRMGEAPRIEKRLADTFWPARCSGSPRSVRLKLLPW